MGLEKGNAQNPVWALLLLLVQKEKLQRRNLLKTNHRRSRRKVRKARRKATKARKATKRSNPRNRNPKRPAERVRKVKKSKLQSLLIKMEYLYHVIRFVLEI